jgi:hypothetical protein
LDRATGYNSQFSTPLDTAEVKHTTKSVAKWTFRNFNRGTFEDYIAKTHTSDMQAFRGKQKGKTKREEGILLLESGASIQDVMKQLKVSRATAYNWKSNP